MAVDLRLAAVRGSGSLVVAVVEVVVVAVTGMTAAAAAAAAVAAVAVAVAVAALAGGLEAAGVVQICLLPVRLQTAR